MAPVPVPAGARWYDRAAFLGERIDRLGNACAAAESATEGIEDLVSAWSKRSAAGDAERFERRLESLGITLGDLPRLVRSPHHDERPTWAVVAEAIGADASDAAELIDWSADERVPFASLLQPWVDRAVTALRERTDVDIDRLVPSLERSLYSRLRQCGEPAVLDVFRQSGSGYRTWVAHQRSTAYADLFDHLPVWGRLAATAVIRWVDAMARFFADLVADGDVVRQRLLAGDPSAFVGLELAGDPHAGGRHVVLLATEAGGRVVYKPRSLAAEQVVADVAAHLRRHDGLDVDAVPPMLDRGDHGWMGWIESQPPTAETMVAYSHRAGALLALARALAITDLHDENVIPAHDRPVLVDLECLATSLAGDRPRPMAGRPHQPMLERSVLTGQLLVEIDRFDEQGRDSSGLTGFQVTGLPETVRNYVWSGLGTDDIELTRRRDRRHCDEPAVTLDIEAVVDGMLRTDEAIARWGLGIDLDRPVDVRVLVHDTSFYVSLLDRSLTTATLSDGLRYSIHLERVAHDATAPDAAPWRLSAATAERELLEAHDVPLFRVDWNATSGRLGTMAIADLVHAPGTATIVERLADTAPDRRRLQADLVRMVLGLRFAVAEEHASGDGDRRPRHDAPTKPRVVAPSDEIMPNAPADACLDVSRVIAEHLDRTAISDDFGGLTWLDIDVSARFPAPILTDDGLFAGNVGVAVFSAALAAVSGESRWADLATRAIAGTPPMADNGLYLGSSGRGYGLTLVGALLDDRSIIERGVTLLKRLPDADVATTKPLDLLFGLPGIAGALAAAAITTGDGVLATKSADYAHAIEHAWRAAANGGILERSEAHRIGVAHGITGITLALSRVHEASDDRQIGKLVSELIERENERIDRRGGIPARLDAVNRSPDQGWCWGAAGYVMARRAIAEITGCTSALHAVETGLDIVREGQGPIDRLCCGRPAQADALGSTNSHIDDLVSRPLQWRFEGTEAHQSASLLRGVSGVGMTLLRAAAPGRLPQPVTLDPIPRR